MSSHVFSTVCACPACVQDRLDHASRNRPLTILDLIIGGIGAAIVTVWSSAIVALACAMFSK